MFDKYVLLQFFFGKAIFVFPSFLFERFDIGTFIGQIPDFFHEHQRSDFQINVYHINQIPKGG